MWGIYLCYHRRVDFFAVLGVFASLTIAWQFDCMGGESAKTSVALFAAIAGLSGTLLGFAITSLALLIGLFQSAEFGPLRKNQDYGSVFADYKLAIVVLAITTLFALGATVAAAARLYNSLILAAALGLVVWSSITMAHAAEILWLAIKTHTNAEQDI